MKDKFFHFFGSMMATMLLNVFLNINIVMIVVFSIGILKEVYDWRMKKTKFDVEDIIFNIGGILIGVMLLQLK